MSNNKQTAIYIALASAFVLGSSQVQAANGARRVVPRASFGGSLRSYSVVQPKEAEQLRRCIPTPSRSEVFGRARGYAT